MEPIFQPALADQEVNGFASSLSKSSTESHSDKQAGSASTYTNHNQTIPQYISVTNNESEGLYPNTLTEQETSTGSSPVRATNSQLIASLERQHLDQDNDNQEESASGYGILGHQVIDIQEHDRIDPSDPALELNLHIGEVHTDHHNDDVVLNSAQFSETADLQEDSMGKQSIIENQRISVEEPLYSETGEASKSEELVRRTSEVQQHSTEMMSSVSAMAASQSEPSDTEQYQSSSVIIEPVSPQAISATTSAAPSSRREIQPITVITNRVWESDKDANECRRCKRRFNFLLRRHHCRRCGQVVCDRCSTHRANMARSQIVQDPSIPNWQHAQLANQPQRICDRCYTEMRSPAASRSVTAPPSQPQRVPGHAGHIRKSASSQSIMSECPVCGKRLCDISLDKSAQEEHVQTCLNVGSPSVATVRYVSYKLPEQSPLIGQECLICFEEFEPGKLRKNLCRFLIVLLSQRD